MTKLSRTQQELLDAMKAGAAINVFSNGTGYLRRDTFQRCHVPAKALVRKGLARIVDGAYLVLVEPQPEKAITDGTLVEAD